MRVNVKWKMIDDDMSGLVDGWCDGGGKLYRHIYTRTVLL